MSLIMLVITVCPLMIYHEGSFKKTNSPDLKPEKCSLLTE